MALLLFTSCENESDYSASESRQREAATGSNTLSTHVKRSPKVKTTIYASLKDYSSSDDFKL